MKKSILAVVLGGWVVASVPQAGAQTAVGETVTIPAPAGITVPTTWRYMDPVEFSDYKGGYELSNGQTLVLSRSGHRMYAEIDRQGAHQIVPTARDTFVALDGKLQVRLELGSFGQVGGELLMVVPASSVAGEAAGQGQLLRMALR